MKCWSPSTSSPEIPRVLLLISSCLLSSMFIVSLLLAPVVSLATTYAATPDKLNLQHDELWRQETSADFKQWTMNGVAIQQADDHVAARLTPSRSALNCSSVAIDGGAASYDVKSGLCAGIDPYPPGSYEKSLNYYNGSTFYFGTLVSPMHVTTEPITTGISSWNAATPVGSWIEGHIRVLQAKTWSHWYILPIWASDFSTIHRHSVDGQTDATGSVDTDTFHTVGQRATAYQLSYTLFSTSPTVSPSIRRISTIASNDARNFPLVPADTSVWGKKLPVPQRSQMLKEYRDLGFGGGGEAWCSPTSTSMVMAYWSHVLAQHDLHRTIPDAAAGTYDFTYQGTGNWPFNTAYAARYGLRTFVSRMYSMSQIEQWIKVGVPIVISIAYQKGELPGSPIPSSTGHLLVVRGFTVRGDVITNDPAAATNAAVEITYPRAALEQVWQKYSHGTVYIMYPEEWPTPTVDKL